MSDNPYQTPEVAEVSAPIGESTGAEKIRQAHLKTETSLKGMGVLFLLGAILCIFAVISVVATVAGAEGSAPVLTFVLIYLLIIPVQIASWWGLRRLRPWAKIPAGILAGIGLLGFPIGTIISAYFLYLIFGAKGRMVLSAPYAAIVEQTPGMKYRTPVWNWVVLGILLLLLVGIIAFALFYTA